MVNPLQNLPNNLPSKIFFATSVGVKLICSIPPLLLTYSMYQPMNTHVCSCTLDEISRDGTIHCFWFADCWAINISFYVSGEIFWNCVQLFTQTKSKLIFLEMIPDWVVTPNIVPWQHVEGTFLEEIWLILLVSYPFWFGSISYTVIYDNTFWFPLIICFVKLMFSNADYVTATFTCSLASLHY